MRKRAKKVKTMSQRLRVWWSKTSEHSLPPTNSTEGSVEWKPARRLQNKASYNVLIYINPTAALKASALPCTQYISLPLGTVSPHRVNTAPLCLGSNVDIGHYLVLTSLLPLDLPGVAIKGNMLLLSFLSSWSQLQNALPCAEGNILYLPNKTL